MHIEFAAHNYDLDDRIREYTQKKLRKVERFVEEPVEARVNLAVEKHRHRAEIHLAHRFGLLQSADETGDMFDSVNLAVDKLGKQARRSRKKFFDKRRKADRGIQEWPIAVVEPASIGAGREPNIVKSGSLPIRMMGIEEAASELSESSHDFVVFRNASSGQINVLYRRRDDNYGLITAES